MPPPMPPVGVAGEGAVRHRHRARFVVDAAAAVVALLPERVLFVTVSVPTMLSMPPPRCQTRYCRRGCCSSPSACRRKRCRCRRRSRARYCRRRCCSSPSAWRQSLMMPPPLPPCATVLDGQVAQAHRPPTVHHEDRYRDRSRPRHPGPARRSRDRHARCQRQRPVLRVVRQRDRPRPLLLNVIVSLPDAA